MSLFRRRDKRARGQHARHEAPSPQGQAGAQPAPQGRTVGRHPYTSGGVGPATSSPQPGSEASGQGEPGGPTRADRRSDRRARRKARRARKPKRSWKSKLGEFAIWSAVAIGTALILISMSETLLPTNF